jgi:hypothetical protein
MATTVAFSPMVFPSNLGDELWNSVKPIPGMHGLRMSDKCSTEMYQFILSGVEKLKTKDPNQLDHEIVFTALADVTRLMNRMVEAALTDRKVVIESDIFERLKGWFCPCYPFC